MATVWVVLGILGAGFAATLGGERWRGSSPTRSSRCGGAFAIADPDRLSELTWRSSIR
jgi:hypothetical protein